MSGCNTMNGKVGKRVTLFRNGLKTSGKVIYLPNTLKDLLDCSSEKLEITAQRVFLSTGGEVDDISLLRDDDVLFITNGEDYVYPVSTMLSSGWITLNVGGKHFTTTKSNITEKEPFSMLARMFAEENDQFLMNPSVKDSSGAFLIDRSPMYFEPILNYLRNGEIIIDSGVNPQGVLEEAKFYGIESMIPHLENHIQNEVAKTNDNAPLTRQEVIKALISTTTAEDLRFQGVNLAGADLNRLDLRNINFKYACLSRCNLVGANLSQCCLERADLSYANLEGAQLLGIKALCANMEGTNLRSCNLEDPQGTKAILEGVNLKGANMEGSNMAGVNLRVATLKNAILQNCDLRFAIMAGADLENCDLSGSDLQEANLRGANLKDATFELMLTPLHMSQTVR